MARQPARAAPNSIGEQVPNLYDTFVLNRAAVVSFHFSALSFWPGCIAADQPTAGMWCTGLEAFLYGPAC